VLDQQSVELQNARVATIGERAEDVFFVTTRDQDPLDEPEQAALKAALEAALSDTGRRN
jgi:[protein-PII] uridylyltransferase